MPKQAFHALQMTFKCPYLDSSSPNGLIEYTNFKDGYREYSPAIPSSIIYKKLKPLRTAIERKYGLAGKGKSLSHGDSQYLYGFG